MFAFSDPPQAHNEEEVAKGGEREGGSVQERMDLAFLTPKLQVRGGACFAVSVESYRDRKQ